MKKFLFGYLILFVLSCNTTKQLKVAPKVSQEEGYELKMFYQPDSEYVTDLDQVTNTSMSIPSMPEQSSETKVISSTILRIGPLKNNECEMLIFYDEMDMQMTGPGSEQIETPDLSGMKVYGKLKEGVQSIDSIVGIEQSLQATIENLIEPLFSNMQVNFPNPMKIGEEFLDTKVIEMPIAGAGSSTITIDTKYTLTKVTNGIADLTTMINISGMMSVMENEIPIKGSGSGDMTLDLVQHYSPSSSTVIIQEIIMDMQGMEMRQKVKVTALTKNKKVK